jgi:hypothetical protein
MGGVAPWWVDFNPLACCLLRIRSRYTVGLEVIAKIIVIIDFPPPTSVQQLRATLGHTGYYRKFIRGYAQIIAPMEKLLKKEVKF